MDIIEAVAFWVGGPFLTFLRGELSGETKALVEVVVDAFPSSFSRKSKVQSLVLAE